MKVECNWKSGSFLETKIRNHTLVMDAKAPFGKDEAPTPKEVTLASLCGCTGMDILALLKKYKQPFESFSIEAETEQTEGHPAVFKEVRLNYKITGAVAPEKALEAVKLSMTKFCGVSAMLSKACQIVYTVTLGENIIGQGKAEF